MSTTTLQSFNASSSLIDLVTHDWQNINLSKLRSDLDNKLENIYAQTEEAKRERKELSTTTRNFRSLPDKEKLSSLGNVFKSYQKHIDSITKQSKQIETAFLTVYKILTDAPDPVDALQSAQVKLLETQKYILENEDMKTKLDNYEREFKELKNQEITVRNLELKIKENEMLYQDKIKEEIEKERTKLEKEYETLLNESQTDTKELKLAIESKRDEVIELRKQLDSAQSKLLSANLLNEETLGIEESAKTMIEEELDRANAMITTLQNERSELQKKVEKFEKMERTMRHTSNDASGLDLPLGDTTSTLRKQLNDYRKINSDLKTEMKLKTSKLEAELESMRNSMQRVQGVNEKLRLQLKQLPSEEEYSFLKNKVAKLQKQFLAFDSNVDDVDQDSVNEMASEDDVDSTGVTGLSANRKKSGISPILSIDASMDTLFYQKTRKMESQITKYKLESYKKSDELRECQNEIEKLRDENEEQGRLISKLENDLTQTMSTPTVPGSTGSAQDSNKNLFKFGAKEDSSANALAQLLSEGMDEKKVREDSKSTRENDKTSGKNEDKASAFHVIDLGSAADTTQPKTPSGADKKGNSNNNNSDAFGIVCSQRDRFRNKMQHFEKENVRLQTRVNKLENDKTLLKQENVQLFQKIKFLENYGSRERSSDGPSVTRSMYGFNGSKSSMTNRMSNNNSNNSINKEVEMKYEVLYEDSLNPFAKFRQKEKQSRIENLQWTEWIAYHVGSTVLSRKMFRIFATIYAIFLHLLTFFAILHEFRSHGLHLSDHPDCLQFVPNDAHDVLPPVQLEGLPQG